ncbi:GNAT family N-acetyltransferase [Lichenicoccus sp.]|uniref:GNAT family N-acetyltransferase n=1 Tax=Lichenicoccus sp. TaxID=2781899 RepID=UPI003D0B1AFF
MGVPIKTLDIVESSLLPVQSGKILKPYPAFSVFHEPWWLDAVTDGNWHQAEVRQGGTVVGTMPYIIDQRFGCDISMMPLMTRTLGPVIKPGSGKPASEFRRRTEIVEQLISQLPKASVFEQRFDPAISDVLKFQEAGFACSVEYTFRTQPGQSAADMWSSMLDKTRNLIRSATKEGLTACRIDDADTFCDFYESMLQDRGRQNLYTTKAMQRACREALRRDTGTALGAYDAAGVLQAAIFLVWDKSTSYYLLTTRQPKAHSGAVSLLLWQGMQDAAAAGRVFDFDGVATPGIAKFLSGFGGTLQSRMTVSRTAMTFRVRRFLTERAHVPALVWQGARKRSRSAEPVAA